GCLGKLSKFERRHSLCQIDEEKFDEYEKFYEFVLVDYSGYFNIAYGLSPNVFQRLSIEAADGAVKLKYFSEFENLFLTEEEFSASYDVYISETVVSSECEENFVDVIIGAQVLAGWDLTLIRGPPAKTVEAQEFREFWGEKCELRKFPDNAICEAIVWDRRRTSFTTLFRIFEYIMHSHFFRHLKLSNSNLIKRIFDFAYVNHFNDSRYHIITKSFDKLSQMLRDLKDLPLLIASIHPVSGYLRHNYNYVFCIYNCLVHLIMEQSGKWGDDLDAIAHLKAAFYIALSKSLKIQKVDSTPCFNHLLVTLVTSTLINFYFSVSHQYPAFSGTCRLALRWLSAHMLSSYISDIVVEIIVAAVFVKPLFLCRPQTVYLGFLHFLILLSRHKWLLKPLIVDFNGEWTESDKEEIEAEFVKLRPVLPAMVVCTPADRSGIIWTKEEPQPLILKRILVLVRKCQITPSLHFLQSFFCPQLSAFDAIIYLHSTRPIRKRSHRGKMASNRFPVVDYNPVRNFVKSLEESFHAIALFFFDKYGAADKIGVVWKKNFIQDRPISNSLCRRKAKSNGKLAINLASVMEDFAILGGTLVDKVVSNNIV
uniref:Nucleolar protein 6 n=1 Tax=Syphacia muris TaxID=451379 RepID=A0A0N5AKB9_9BILA